MNLKFSSQYLFRLLIEAVVGMVYTGLHHEWEGRPFIKAISSNHPLIQHNSVAHPLPFSTGVYD